MFCHLENEPVETTYHIANPDSTKSQRRISFLKILNQGDPINAIWLQQLLPFIPAMKKTKNRNHHVSLKQELFQ
ncbi:hypothetical protein BVRB_7g180810 [Beta vulgaris subsp. vulgaris]|uniref:Uncharacterized protein n=1 Tax=Beta vulgaris subsp. vulgaris TaxID=3555 RepID=A0A0J8E199_BETVV|nr:hypothetical protein BVRB_7g180810 [Beta vulgaris subsp. vulgaris]